MKVIVNDVVIGEIVTNCPSAMNVEHAMWCLGYDLSDENDLKTGYENGVEGFCYDDGIYFFDREAVYFDFSK